MGKVWIVNWIYVNTLRLLTTSNCSAVASSHTLQFTKYALSSLLVC
jgi:hypothetical protein